MPDASDTRPIRIVVMAMDGSVSVRAGHEAAPAVQSGMVIAAAVAALSVTAGISGTPDSRFPTPNAQGTVGIQADRSNGADPAALPISIERIRDVLQRPPGLWIPPLPEPTVTFRSSVEDTLPYESVRSEEHTSELQSPCNLVCRLLLEKKK